MSIRSASAAVCGIIVAAGLAFAHPPATETGFIQVEPDVRLFYQRFETGTPWIFFPTRSQQITTYAPLRASPSGNHNRPLVLQPLLELGRAREPKSFEQRSSRDRRTFSRVRKGSKVGRHRPP